MVDTTVADPAPAFGWPDFQWPVRSKKSPLAQVFPQGRLQNRGERGRGLLSCK